MINYDSLMVYSWDKYDFPSYKRQQYNVARHPSLDSREVLKQTRAFIVQMAMCSIFHIIIYVYIYINNYIYMTSKASRTLISIKSFRISNEMDGHGWNVFHSRTT